MKILLTGGAGYIGSHTAVALVNAGHHIVLLDNLSNSDCIAIRRLREVIKDDFPFIQGDVRDKNLLIKIIRAYKIDGIMHFAGLKSVGESNSRPIEYYSSNVHGAISLLEAMSLTNVKLLVFSSSATVYGVPEYLPIDELHSTSATNPYGRTKLHIEEMLIDVCNSDHEWKVAGLRYFNPVGAHSSARIGELPRGIPNNLMPFITQVAAGERARLSVYGDDYETKDGSGVRDFIHVMDLAEGHVAALQYLIETSSSGWNAFNLGTGNGYSVLELIREFEAVTGKKITRVIEPRRKGDVAVCYADTKKAEEILKWKAKRSLKEMCNSAWQWQEWLRSKGDVG